MRIILAPVAKHCCCLHRVWSCKFMSTRHVGMLSDYLVHSLVPELSIKNVFRHLILIQTYLGFSWFADTCGTWLKCADIRSWETNNKIKLHAWKPDYSFAEVINLVIANLHAFLFSRCSIKVLTTDVPKELVCKPPVTTKSSSKVSTLPMLIVDRAT